jgi:hypothetical protein
METLGRCQSPLDQRDQRSMIGCGDIPLVQRLVSQINQLAQ